MKAEPNCRPLSLVLLPALLLLSFAQTTAAPSNNVTPEASCPSCDDLNFCTVDSCDPTTGTCRHDPLSCDDHNPCTTDSCSPFGVGRGTCDHGELPIGTACSDGDPCTQGDSCRIVGTTSFRCVGTPLAAGSSCDDGNSCTTSDTCSNTGQ